MAVNSRKALRVVGYGLLLVVISALSGIAAGSFLIGRHLGGGESDLAGGASSESEYIFGQVERVVVAEEVSFRAQAVAGDERPKIIAEAVAGRIVTAVPDSGDGHSILMGGVVGEFEGRPLILFPGSFPFYRTLMPSEEGADVRQLQEGLSLLGYLTTVDGVFGPGTQEGLGKLYVNLGYEALPGEEVELSEFRRAVEDATAQVAAATKALERAKTTASTASTTTPVEGDAADLEALESEVRLARRGLDDATKALHGARLQAGPSLQAAEFLVVKDGPVTISELVVKVGERVADDGLLGYSSAKMEQLEGEVVGAADFLKVGGAVTVETDDGEAKAEVVSLEQQDGAYLVRVVPTDPDVEFSDDRTFRVRVSAGTTGVEVLAVPVTAISERSDSSRFVSVWRDGDLIEVPVETGQVGRGMVEILEPNPLLSVGDSVVLGIDRNGDG